MHEVIGGCTFAEQPDCDIDKALICWTAELVPNIISVSAIPSLSAGAVNLQQYRGRLFGVRDEDGTEHVVLSDGMCRIALDVCNGTLFDGSVSLGIELINSDQSKRQLTQLDRLLAALADPLGKIPACHTIAANRKIVTALRVADGLAAGASHRELAIALFGAERVAADWLGISDALRSQVRRLVKSAQYFSGGGWRDICH